MTSWKHLDFVNELMTRFQRTTFQELLVVDMSVHLTIIFYIQLSSQVWTRDGTSPNKKPGSHCSRGQRRRRRRWRGRGSRTEPLSLGQDMAFSPLAGSTRSFHQSGEFGRTPPILGFGAAAAIHQFPRFYKTSRPPNSPPALNWTVLDLQRRPEDQGNPSPSWKGAVFFRIQCLRKFTSKLVFFRPSYLQTRTTLQSQPCSLNGTRTPCKNSFYREARASLPNQWEKIFL